MVDLFGRPIYDAGRVSQPALFSEEHWFRLGYLDSVRGFGSADEAREQAAYLVGYKAGCREQQAGNYGDPDRAFRQARAVGNVE